jgi:SWI/SNF-related matrix-associated actin-dependent regulator 1 of chromatin subfamily A
MKAEVLSSSVVRLTGACATAAVVRALEPYSKGSLSWEVPHEHVPEGLVPRSLIALASRPPLSHAGLAVKVPDDLWSTLFPYQREGVLRMVHQFKGRCLLADDMGLGKTLQAIACILHYELPTLVVCPAFLCANWERALEQCGACATVCSYGKVGAGTYGMVVVDEAHFIKSRESQRAQALLPIILAAPHALLLSGTPCPNRPEELFMLMHALRPSLVPDFTSFAARYCNPRRTPFCAYDTRGSDRPRELKWLLSRAFEVRRKKLDVLPQLPPKMQRILYVEADPAHRRELACLQDKFDAAMRTGSKLAQTLIMEMYRCTAHAKAQSAAALVASKVQPGTLIFAHHQVVLDAMQQALPACMRVGRIDGRTSLPMRQRVVDGMQSGELDVALLSMGAAGVGLTLTRACVAFFLEIPWCPAVLRQCEDRIHRIGQEHPCTMYYVLADKTLDAHVWTSIHRKERVAERIGQG